MSVSKDWLLGGWYSKTSLKIPKGVIRIWISKKNRQDNGQMKRDKRTTMIYKTYASTKDRVMTYLIKNLQSIATSLEWLKHWQLINYDCLIIGCRKWSVKYYMHTNDEDKIININQLYRNEEGTTKPVQRHLIGSEPVRSAETESMIM